ncbi:MAG: helix-turn-helix transcriptional regulator [Clostridia bacterium]|nr:helix-turn-helix transcriptional regulator [Clostridia bacterium]
MSESGKALGSKTAPSAGEHLTALAEAYVREHSSERFSLQAMAGALYVNGSYLLRVYKAQTGHTLLWFHHHVRCENAKKLLSDTDLSIAVVGETVSFVSAAHFSHIFKKLTGMTPSAYRQVYRGVEGGGSKG